MTYKVIHHSVSCTGILTSYPPNPNMALKFLDAKTHNSRKHTHRNQNYNIIIVLLSSKFYLLCFRLFLFWQRMPLTKLLPCRSQGYIITCLDYYDGRMVLPCSSTARWEALGKLNPSTQSLCWYQLWQRLATCDNRLLFTWKERGRFSQNNKLPYIGQHSLKN